MLYHDLDKLLNGQIDRRSFLRRMAALGVATPAVLAFLEACQSGSGPSTGTIGPPTGVTKEYAASHPVSFNIWEFRPDIVRKSVTQFNTDFQENCTLQVLPGDYVTTELNKLLGGSPIGMVYSQSELVKFYKAGYIMPLDDLWGKDEIQKATLPTQWEAQTYQGHLLGLPYFHSVKPVLAVNTILAEKAGMKQKYPKSWPEVYTMARAAMKTGALRGPAYLPRWVPTPFEISNMWIAEVQNRGGQVFDASFNPAFDGSSEAAHVLEDWHSLYVDGVVPRSAVTITTDELIDGMASGQFLFSQQELYDFYRMNDPSRSKIAGHVAFAPYAGNDWGFFNYGLYSLINVKGRSALDTSRALRLIRFFGYQNKDNQYWVAKQWAMEENLGVGYPAVYQLPELQSFYKTWQPSEAVLGYNFQAESDKLSAHAHKLPIWNSPWYADFNAAAIVSLTSAVTGSITVAKAITTLRQKAESLIQAYK
jgi:multiple sugar transport system substrate-binding protein